MITERLMGVGKWSLKLSEETPVQVMQALDPRTSSFGHIVITPTAVDGGPGVLSDATMLARSIYTGILRRQPSDYEIGGVGVNAYMGDDDTGLYTASLSVASAYTFALWAAALRPAFLTAGITSTISGAYNNTYTLTTYKQPLLDVCDRFGAEWRVTNDFKFDIGTQTDLFRTTPIAIVARKKGDGGRELGLAGIVGDLEIARDTDDWVRRVRYLSGAGPTVTTADGSVADADVPYRAPDGTALQWTKIVTAPSTVPAGSETAMATAEYNKLKNPRQEFAVSSRNYDISADVRVGDNVYVFDPERGIEDTANQIIYRGSVIRPEIIRCVGYTRPVVRGMGVYFRRYVNVAGTWTVEWTDLTNHVVYETGDTRIEVGAKPRPVTR